MSAVRLAKADRLRPSPRRSACDRLHLRPSGERLHVLCWKTCEGSVPSHKLCHGVAVDHGHDEMDRLRRLRSPPVLRVSLEHQRVRVPTKAQLIHSRRPPHSATGRIVADSRVNCPRHIGSSGAEISARRLSLDVAHRHLPARSRRRPRRDRATLARLGRLRASSMERSIADHDHVVSISKINTTDLASRHRTLPSDMVHTDGSSGRCPARSTANLHRLLAKVRSRSTALVGPRLGRSRR